MRRRRLVFYMDIFCRIGGIGRCPKDIIVRECLGEPDTLPVETRKIRLMYLEST